MVDKTIGGNINVTDTAFIASSVTLNTSTSVKIADIKKDRIFFNVNNNNNTSGFWLKLQAASVDNLKKGIYITGKSGSTPTWEMPTTNIYTGEICAIADVDGPTAYVTEF